MTFLKHYKKYTVDCLYLDFKKAINEVSHLRFVEFGEVKVLAWMKVILNKGQMSTVIRQKYSA